MAVSHSTIFDQLSTIDLLISTGHESFLLNGGGDIEDELLSTIQPLFISDLPLYRQLCDQINDTLVLVLDAGLRLGFELGKKYSQSKVIENAAPPVVYTLVAGAQ